MPETVPGITFDQEGVCSFCHDAEKTEPLLYSEEELERIIASVKGRNPVDAIVPLSGGRDSSFVLYAARELYDSEWFHKASAYAERTADRWYILSAKYGLVDPDTVIEPYDATLKTMPAAARREWAGKALARLLPLLRAGDRVVILAGQAYREHLVGPIEAAGCQAMVPMGGLRIGEQLRWLKSLEGVMKREGQIIHSRLLSW